MSAYPPENDPAVETPIFDRTEYPGVHVPAFGTAPADDLADETPEDSDSTPEYTDPTPEFAAPAYAAPDAAASTTAYSDPTPEYDAPEYIAPVDTTVGSGSSSSGSGKADAAKDAAKDVAGDAKEQAQHVGGVAKEQASKVASEATDHAKQLYGQATESLKDQAGQQQERAAGGLRNISSQLSDMADNADDDNIATKVVRDLSNRAGSVAGFLEGRDPGSLLDEVKSFAARRPGTFIAIAAGAGILAGRLTKALATEIKHEHEAESDDLGGTV